MSDGSRIEWTEATWNPIRGCVKVSSGCKHCYAETFAERFRGVKHHPYEEGFEPRLVPLKLAEPLHWKKPRSVFVNSMSDLFQEAVPTSYVEAVCKVMEIASWHTYQVLTKRAERMQAFLQGRLAQSRTLQNVWWGVSVEDRKCGLPRIDHLARTPARVRFLSIEPLLENIGAIPLEGIHWVIVGGESGPGARPMEESWVRSIQRQCLRSGVPFFFKQWGGVRKGRNGRQLGGVTCDDMPSRSPVLVPSERERLGLLEKVQGIVSRTMYAL